MNIVSSLRPLGESEEIDRNQLRANRSWRKISNQIIYLGLPEQVIETDKTKFFQTPDFPRIKTVAFVAGSCGDTAAIVNADIVLADHTAEVLKELVRRGGKAAVSRRYEFVGENLDGAVLKPDDHGLDFFFATRDLWLKLSQVIPKDFRIGHSAWDTYTLSFLNTAARGACYDITARRCVFHPKHENRKRKYEIKPVDDKWTLNCSMPRAKL